MATLEQLSSALVNADKAGDADAARALASEIVRLKSGKPASTSYIDGLPGQPSAQTVNNWARAAANGATFGLADKFAGGMNAVTGAAPSYEEGVKAERAKTEEFRQSNPVQAAAAEVLGGLATGGGLAGSGVTLAGRVGPGFLPRAIGYGAEGSLYGAAHGAGNTFSNNPMDYASNAGFGAATGGMIGGGMGAAAPIVGAGARAAYRSGSAFFGPRVEGTGRGASALLRGAAMADEPGLRTLGQVPGPAMLPDAGPAMLGLAQGAGTGTGPGRSLLVNNLRARDQTTAQRLAQTLNGEFGPAPIPSRVEAGLSGDRAFVGQEYAPLFENARAVNTQGLANRLEAAAVNARGPEQAALRDVRAMLDIPGAPGNLDPHPRALHSTRQAIDGLMRTEQNPSVLRQLEIARREVDNELARAVPGIKEVDARMAELHRQSGALQRGSQVMDTGKEAIRPTELVDEVRAAVQPQGQMVGPSGAPFRMRQGARAEIDRIIGTSIHDLPTLERKFGTPEDWNYQKLATLFGDPQRGNVAAVISANRRFRDTYQKVVEGSQTAQRSAAAKSMEGTEGGNVPLDVTLTGAGVGGINWIAKTLTGVSNENTRDQVGRLLANANPQDVQRLANILLQSAQTTNARAAGFGRVMSSPGWLGGTAPADHR
jgi:hypothetical protein